MATDDNQSGDPGNSDEKPEDRANRMNAAKAFYRAMYAGEDVVPDDFGMTDPKNSAGAGDRGSDRGGGPCQNCARLDAQVAEAEKLKNEAENFYKRIAADFENYKRRTEKEKEESVGIGIQKAIEQILPALDDMDRARTSLATVTDPKAILDSLNLVFTRFAKCLESAGVKQMEVIGETFDPRLHEPVQEIETNEVADGAVVHELRRGYMYKDKVLRPTLVNVASNPSGVVVPKKPVEAPAQAPGEEKPAEQAPTDQGGIEPEAQAAQAPAQAPVETSQAPVEPPVPEATVETPAPAAEQTSPPQEQTPPAKAEKNEHEPPPKKSKAIEKLKPTRPHTETADLPVFKLDEYDSLQPLPDEADNQHGGTVYDISDADADEQSTV